MDGERGGAVARRADRLTRRTPADKLIQRCPGRGAATAANTQPVAATVALIAAVPWIEPAALAWAPTS